MKKPIELSPLRLQAIAALKRARRLAPGPERSDLRQIAIGLKWLEKHRVEARHRNNAQDKAERLFGRK